MVTKLRPRDRKDPKDQNCPDIITCVLCLKEKVPDDFRRCPMTDTGRGITCKACQQKFSSLTGYIQKGTSETDKSSFTIEMEADNYGLTDEERQIAQLGVPYFVGEMDMSLIRWLESIGVPDERQTKIMSITASLAKETCDVPRARSR